MRIILAGLVASPLLALTLSGAPAAPCPSRPDNADSHYNENQLLLSLCQQQAIDAEVDLQQLKSSIEADLQRLQQQIDLQRQLLDAQRAAASAPVITVGP